MSVSASQVKELRDRTGAGMMDCKKALAEAAGDLSEAADLLRKQGLAQAAKKAGRDTREGAVAIAFRGNSGALVELNCETDFVARTEAFQELARAAAETALASKADSVEALTAAAMEGGGTLETRLTEAVGRLGENLRLARVMRLDADGGIVAGYVHNRYGENVGTLGVLVALTGDDSEALSALGRQLAMHVAAAAPLALDRSALPAEMVEHERKIQEEMVRAEGKAEEMVAKIVEGKLKRFYAESSLLEQAWVLEPKTKVEAVLKEAGTSVSGYARFMLGEVAQTQGEG